jgi:hypothetical protein
MKFGPTDENPIPREHKGTGATSGGFRELVFCEELQVYDHTRDGDGAR